MAARMRSHTGGHSSPTLIFRDGWSIGRRLTSRIREHSTAARSAATSTIPRGKEAPPANHPPAMKPFASDEAPRKSRRYASEENGGVSKQTHRYSGARLSGIAPAERIEAVSLLRVGT